MRKGTVARIRLINKVRKTLIPKIRMRFYYQKGGLNVKFGNSTIPYDLREVHRKSGYWSGWHGCIDNEKDLRHFWKYIQTCAYHKAIHPDFIVDHERANRKAEIQ